LLGLLIGALDPLEGSLVIVPATALIALSAFLARSRFRRIAYWGFGLTTIGVGAMFMIGDVGGSARRPMWWALTFLPYPVGWILCLIAGVRLLIEWNASRGMESVQHGD
jgi:uncharacterized membrane protein YhaH (DUF805 family)